MANTFHAQFNNITQYNNDMIQVLIILMPYYVTKLYS